MIILKISGFIFSLCCFSCYSQTIIYVENSVRDSWKFSEKRVWNTCSVIKTCLEYSKHHLIIKTSCSVYSRSLRGHCHGRERLRAAVVAVSWSFHRSCIVCMWIIIIFFVGEPVLQFLYNNTYIRIIREV